MRPCRGQGDSDVRSGDFHGRRYSKERVERTVLDTGVLLLQVIAATDERR